MLSEIKELNPWKMLQWVCKVQIDVELLNLIHIVGEVGESAEISS